MNPSAQITPLLIAFSLLLFILVSYIKGVALWRSAKGSQRNWFIVLLVFYLFTIYAPVLIVVDIVYLFKYAKNKVKLADLKFWESFSKKR